MIDSQMVFRMLVIGMGILGLVTWAWWAATSRHAGYAVAPLSWLINITLFMFWNTYLREVGTQLELANRWSILVHLHGLMLVVGAAVILLWQRKR